ncbi:MAG: hypothetical protein AAB437_00335 [Patescibacteria group bacterium]
MLTKDDKKFILNTITVAVAKNNDVLFKRFDDLDKKFDKRIDNLATDVIDLFEATNSVIKKLDNKLSNKIDITNERIDKVLDQLKDHNDIIDTHERRIEKVEEKVFSISA